MMKMMQRFSTNRGSMMTNFLWQINEDVLILRHWEGKQALPPLYNGGLGKWRYYGSVF
jgi:hypothetical protein